MRGSAAASVDAPTALPRWPSLSRRLSLSLSPHKGDGLPFQHASKSLMCGSLQPQAKLGTLKAQVEGFAQLWHLLVAILAIEIGRLLAGNLGGLAGSDHAPLGSRTPCVGIGLGRTPERTTQTYPGICTTSQRSPKITGQP